jgi:hypothetical protein
MISWYEPDGNVPPDFLIDGSIAVEVRRLNQHEDNSSEPRGLETLEFQLRAQVEGLLDKLGPPTLGASWFVSYLFSRPLEPWKTLRPKLKDWLDQFRASAQDRGTETDFGRFHISLIKASKEHEKLFVLGGYGDHDASGSLMSKLDRNIRLCLELKTKKIAPYRSRYPEWWLILVDHIAHDLGPEERRLLSERPPIAHDWQRVVVLDSRDTAVAILL